MNERKLASYADRVAFVMSANCINYSVLKNLGFRVETPCIGNGMVAKILRALWLRARLPLQKMWYNKKIQAMPYKHIVVIEGYLTTNDYLRWLQKENPGASLDFIYENPVEKTIHPSKIPQGYTVWSFDREDCKKYGLEYSGVLYIRVKNYEKKDPVNDVYFVGRDKGRGEALIKLQTEMESKGLKPYFHITANRSFLCRQKSYYMPFVQYQYVQENIERSRAILDYLQEGQTSNSIRCFECLFNEIKLITNNESVKDFDFYDPRNIFILRINDMKTLPAFLCAPYHPVPEEILNQYLFVSWMEKAIAK